MSEGATIGDAGQRHAGPPRPAAGAVAGRHDVDQSFDAWGAGSGSILT
ncbi:MAG: hypothetical protein M3380_15305 [Chloroflexota bacterium]|nr:hypothetical protein [Chloroflexota bacterium]